MRKTVLYIIETLGLGGAEMLVVSQLSEVHKNYNIVLVTLYPVNQFEPGLLVYDHFYCLNMKGNKDALSAATKLRYIINQHEVDLVHSVLYWSVIVARLACGNKTKHISSLATIMSQGAYRVKWYSSLAKLLDKLTYKKSETIIAASEEVLNDYDQEIGIKGRSKVIHNFVNDEFFDHSFVYNPSSSGLKLVAVGNYKKEKNYQYLLDSFYLLKDQDISIDVYGQGPSQQIFQDQIDHRELNITLKGPHNNIQKILPEYDGYVMCSVVEGFGIAAAEAMAIGLPLMLSNIPVLREVSQGNAHFFDPRKPVEFADLMKKILADKSSLIPMSNKGKLIAKENYTKACYIKSLFDLFEEVLSNKPYRKETFNIPGYKPQLSFDS